MVRRGERVQVASGEACRLEARRHAFGGQRAAASGQRRVGLDELLIEFAELRFAGALRARMQAGEEQGNRATGRQGF